MSNNIAQILVFGDEETESIAKTLWSQLSGMSVRVVPISKILDIETHALEAIMIFWSVDDRLSLIHGMVQKLAQNTSVTAEMIAVTHEKDAITRLKLMSAGFDNIFNRETMDSKEFASILKNKVAKGQARLLRRVREEELVRLKAALSTSPDAYIIFDAEKRITFLSEHYGRVYPKSALKMVPGTHVKQALDWVMEEIGFDEKNPRYPYILEFWTSLQGSAEFHLNNNRILRVKATPLVEGKGTIVTTTDVTEYKRVTNLLEQKSEELEKALASERDSSATQRQFIAMVSHEFRTPLTIIDGNAQLIERQATSTGVETIDALKKRARTIRSGVSRLVQMMEAILSSNLARTGKLEPSYAEFNLKALVNELCEEQKDISRNLEIKAQFNDVPEKIRQDRKFITLILTNLITNAVKFSPENPKVDVTVSFSNGAILLQVKDQGIGIPHDELEHIFKKFFRASNATAIPGTGFGMSLTKDLVEALGGKVSVESDLGQKTIFTVQIPLK